MVDPGTPGEIRPAPNFPRSGKGGPGTPGEIRRRRLISLGVGREVRGLLGKLGPALQNGPV